METEPKVSVNVLRLPPGSHPVERGTYTLGTVAIDEAYEQAYRWVKNRVPGAAIVGPSRFGKTRAIRYMQTLLKDDFPAMPLFSFRCVHTKTRSEGRFYEWMLASLEHDFPASGKPDAKFRRLVEYLHEQVAATNQNRLTAFLDDAHNLSEDQYQWLADIYNALEARDCKMTILLVGQPELLHQRTALLTAKKHQLVGRFMVSSYEFHGVRNAGELKEILRGYDDRSEYPSGSGCSFTRYFFPTAYANGWRLAQLAQGLWEAFCDVRPNAGKTHVGMQYCCAACEYLLQEQGDVLAEAPGMGENILREAVAVSGFAESEVALGG